MDARARFSPRIALHGIGHLGKTMTRLIRDKGWEIVAAYNRAGEKIGQDLGTLAGLDKPLGVIVQDSDKADYTKLKADVALIAAGDALDDNYPAIERFLSRGINVLSHGAHMYDPYWFHPELAEKVDALGKKHNATFTGGGMWDMTRIWSGLIAAGPCIRIDSIEYITAAETLRQGAHWAPLLGYGLTVAEYDAKIGRASNRMADVLQLPSVIVLQQYGFTVTDVKVRQEPVVFDEPVYCPQLDIEYAAGLCVGRRTLIDVETREGVTAFTKFEFRVFKPGEIEEGTWKINGLPGMQVKVIRDDSSVASAASLINRIPDVIKAKPGIVTVMDMGPLKHSVFL